MYNEKSRKFVFDMDGTICKERNTFEKPLAEPIPKVVELINKLYHEGNHIIIYTARGWAEFAVTEDWLKKNGVKYDVLMCGKPIYDYWIDDRCLTPEEAVDSFASVEAKACQS